MIMCLTLDLVEVTELNMIESEMWQLFCFDSDFVCQVKNRNDKLVF